MAIQPQKVPQNDIIRGVKDVVDHNADLQIVSGEATDTGLSLATAGGVETVEIDLHEKFVTRAEYENGEVVPPATESVSGRIQIVTDAEAQNAGDDSKAMTARKTLLLLVKLGLATINPDGTITINLGGAGDLTLDDVIGNGAATDSPPFFYGGLFGTLPAPPTGANLANVQIEVSTGKFYKAGSVVTNPTDEITSIVFDQFEHFQFVPDAGALPDAYIGRFDFNNCGTNGNTGQAGGWFANTNYPLIPVVVRVERDGIFYKNVTADRPRGNDVRLYLQNQGLVTTSRENFSWVVDKSPDDNDGKPHTYRFFGGTSSVEASSDTGAENALTCGTPAPYIVQYVLLASATVAGGSEGNARMKANYSDSSEAPYIGAGTYSKQGSWPTGAVVTPGASATAKVGNPIGTTPIDRVVTLRFTLPGDGTSYAEETLTLLASGLLGVKYEVVVNAGNSSLRDLTYYLKSTVDVAAKTYVNGTLVDTATQITPSIVDAGGYTRKSYIQGQNVGAVIKHEFYYVDGTVVIFEHTVALGSAVTLNAIYP